jgi:threonyl-tRNA synthetase
MSHEKPEKGSSLYNVRHSLAHMLAQAVLEMFPDAKLGTGPVTENGFYYDFDLPRTLIPEDLKLLEKAMRKQVQQNQSFVRSDQGIQESIKFLKKIKQPYKIELVNKFVDQLSIESVSFYENVREADQKGVFVDLCEGGHVENTKELDAKAFKLSHISSAYWQADENNASMQRIYGISFETADELIAYQKMMEEAKKRDHRKLGQELNLFTFDERVGAGLPLWCPNGAVIVEEIEKLAKETEQAAGYDRVRTPHIAKGDLYRTSGHLPYYADSMYPPMKLDDSEDEYYLKAMNCPHHHIIYGSEKRSYRGLPLRLAEYGHCYRYEDSGALFGLMRVRSMSMNDAHIYCTPAQFEEEFINVIEMYKYYFKIFGIEKYAMRLSLHSKAGLGKKYVDEPELWIQTEAEVRSAMEKTDVPFVEVEDEAAFYGPKIDVQVWSVIGREFTLSTNQLDFAVPKRFDLTYVDSDGEEKTPLAIHRAPLSTHERLIGFLIEHFGGAFPTWLAPVQVEIIPVAEPHMDYAIQLREDLRRAGVRTKIFPPDETLGKRIRNAEKQKIPYMLVVGDKEVESGHINARSYHTKDQKDHDRQKFIDMLKEEISERRLPNS